jgi:ABC-type sulfate transport system permease subunit
MALGTTLFAWGFVTSPVVLGLGLVLLTLSLGGWIGEIRHEHRQD